MVDYVSSTRLRYGPVSSMRVCRIVELQTVVVFGMGVLVSYQRGAEEGKAVYSSKVLGRAIHAAEARRPNWMTHATTIIMRIVHVDEGHSCCRRIPAPSCLAAWLASSEGGSVRIRQPHDSVDLLFRFGGTYSMIWRARHSVTFLDAFEHTQFDQSCFIQSKRKRRGTKRRTCQDSQYPNRV